MKHESKILHSYNSSPRDVYKHVYIPGGIKSEGIHGELAISDNIPRRTNAKHTMYTAIAIAYVTDHRGCAIAKNSWELERYLHRIYEASGIVQEITFIDKGIEYLAHFETEKFPYYIQVPFLRFDLHKIEKLAKYKGFNLTAITPSYR